MSGSVWPYTRNASEWGLYFSRKHKSTINQQAYNARQMQMLLYF